MSSSAPQTQFDLPEVTVSQTPLERFVEYLRTKGKRVTSPQKVIVEEVFKRHEHFDADQLIESLKQSDVVEPPSRPTVYRTLEKLEEAGLLRKVTLAGRRFVYEHDYGYPAHDHLQCEECGTLIEFHSDEVVRIRQAVGLQQKFKVTGHKLIITGICKECQDAKRRRTRPLDLV